MTKIDELLDSCVFLQYKSDIDVVERIMKEYAEWYARKVVNNIYQISEEDNLDGLTILNIELPEHE